MGAEALPVRSIWLDEERAEEEIARRLREGSIDDAEAASLNKFITDGYIILTLDLTAGDARRFQDDVERLWSERPANISFAFDSPPHRFSYADAARHRRPRYRIHDMHSWSEVAMSLYLHPKLLRFAGLILGEEAVATQSLFFEFGSQQGLHRDSIVVPTPIFGHLLAAWIALEDIHPHSGPLMYVPGSHKMPMYEFRPGQYLFDYTSMGEKEVTAATAFHEQEMRRMGLETRRFEARRGEVLIWHSALLHGGAPPVDERRTRRSFVVHYSTLRTHRTRSTSLSEQGKDHVWTTAEVMERGAARGFANPLDGHLEYVRS